MRTAGQGPGGFEKRDGAMKPGQDLVLVGYAGLEGTRAAFRLKKEELKNRFPVSFLEELEREDSFSAETWLKEALLSKDNPITAFEYAAEGGILAALWNISGIFCAGIDVDLRAIPMRQVTVEVCEALELNPYRLQCGNCVILAVDRGGQLVRQLRQEQIPAAVIGAVIPGDARRIRHEEESAGYLERPQPDELEKLKQRLSDGPQ